MMTAYTYGKAEVDCPSKQMPADGVFRKVWMLDVKGSR